jgi:excisionase family DNA binding protein
VESLTSREAAERLGVNVQKFHRLVAEHEIRPILKGTGLRGEKFWKPSDITRLVIELRQAS